jgi:polyphosphate kinase
VYVDLIVRGICCLRPGLPGVSENIRVRSIVGRFLEHSRVYYFHNGGNEELYCASADWMERNFFRRIELMFPISDPALKARVMADLDTYLADNVQAWELRNDGTYEQSSPPADRDATPAQSKLLRQLAEAS